MFPDSQEIALESVLFVLFNATSVIAWLFAVTIVGGFWVKTRRARKARTTYVPSN